MVKRIILLLLSLIFISGYYPDNLLGQDRWKIQRIESGINFDGVPDEPVWDSIVPFPMVTHLPVSGKIPEEKSVIKMAYDQQYLYVGGLLYVSDPGYIQALGKKRDMFAMSTDWLGIKNLFM